MFHICNKQFKSKRRCRRQGTASTNNLSTKQPFNQSSNGVQLGTPATWSGLLILRHVSTSLYNGRLASSPSTAASNADTTSLTSPTTTTEVAASTAPHLEARGSSDNELRKLTNLAEHAASSTRYFCITEASFDNKSAKEIALNVTLHGGTEDIYIYRFRPGSTITVSINWESFKSLKLGHDQATNFRDHLERAINRIRCGQLGIQFRLVPEEDLGPDRRGVIDVQYGGEGRLPDTTKIGWARSEFPQRNKDRYTLEVFSTTFEPESRNFTYNIMLHEFAHLMSMRHHPCVQRRDWKNEVLRLLHPAGDSKTKSIMGDWTELQDLEFSETDIRDCRDFYNLPADVYSTQNVETRGFCNVRLVDVPVHDGIIPKTYG